MKSGGTHMMRHMPFMNDEGWWNTHDASYAIHTDMTLGTRFN